MEDLATSADIAISTMYQFGMQAKDLTYISDVLAQGSVKSNISLKDLGESLKYASSTAVLLKQDLPTVTAMIMTLGNAGMKGSMAGVGLENMYRYLSLGLGEFKKKKRVDTWAAIGVNPDQMIDAKGDLKPMVEILHTLRNAIGSFGTVDQGNILYQIFGVRGKRPPAVFLQELELLEKNLRYTQNAGGVSKALYEKQMAGPEGTILKMKAAFAEMVNSFTQTLVPVLVPFMKMITIALEGLKEFFDSTAGRVLTPILTVFLAVKTAMWGIKAIMAMLTISVYNLRTSLAGIRAASAISMGPGLMGMLGFGSMGGAVGPGLAAQRAAAAAATANAPYNRATAWNPNRPWTSTTPYPWNSPGYAANQFSKSGQIGNLNMGAHPYSSTTAAGARYTVTPGQGATFATGAWGAPQGKLGWGGRFTGAMGGAAANVAGGVGLSMGVGNMLAGQSMGEKVGGGMQAVGGGMMLWSPEPVTKAIGAGIMLVGTAINFFASRQAENTAAVKANTEATKTETLSRVRVVMGNRQSLTWTEYANEKDGQGSRSAGNKAHLANQLKEYLRDPAAYGGRFIDTSNPTVINLYVGNTIAEQVKRQTNKTINQALMQ
jgi:TP901 family phage tail tape measure protein